MERMPVVVVFRAFQGTQFMHKYVHVKDGGMFTRKQRTLLFLAPIYPYAGKNCSDVTLLNNTGKTGYSKEQPGDRQ